MSPRQSHVRCSTPPIVRRALVDALRKLDPRRQIRNPVMFVVLVGSVLTTALFFQALAGQGEAPPGFIAAVSRVALVHGAVRELRRGDGRGPRQGAGRRAAPRAPRDRGAPARRRSRRRALRSRGGAHARARELGPAQGRPRARRTGEVIPGDGEIDDGIASVDESAITGESAPVIREGGGDRSAVTGGTRVLSDWLVVRITAEPGETFLDRMIALVEGAKRQKTPNEIALDILLAALTIVFLLATATLLPFSLYAVSEAGHGRARHGDRARRAARLPDPDDDRRPALGDRHRGHGPHDPGERDRDLGPRGRGGRRRRRAAARQDRHDHARQPPGDRVPARAPASTPRSSPTRRSSPRSPTRRPRAAASSCSRRSATACASATCTRSARTLRAVHRADAHERRRPRRPLAPQGRGRRHRALRARARRRRSRPRCARRSSEVARRGRHAARRRRRHARARRHPAQGHREGRHPRALRRAAPRWASGP